MNEIQERKNSAKQQLATTKKETIKWKRVNKINKQYIIYNVRVCECANVCEYVVKFPYVTCNVHLEVGPFPHECYRAAYLLARLSLDLQSFVTLLFFHPSSSTM